jgi:hypothetical protein
MAHTFGTGTPREWHAVTRAWHIPWCSFLGLKVMSST